MKWTWLPKVRKGRGGVEEGGEKRKRQEEAKVKDVVEEVQRHWRGLHRKEELAG